MRKFFLGSLIGLSGIASCATAQASVIPPHQVTVLTQCGTPVAVFIPTATGFHKITETRSVMRLASQVPFQNRVAGVCGK
jgi:hypothetical protein